LHLKEKGRDVNVGPRVKFNNENQEVKNNTLNKETFNLKSQGKKYSSTLVQCIHFH